MMWMYWAQWRGFIADPGGTGREKGPCSMAWPCQCIWLDSDSGILPIFHFENNLWNNYMCIAKAREGHNNRVHYLCDAVWLGHKYTGEASQGSMSRPTHQVRCTSTPIWSFNDDLTVTRTSLPGCRWILRGLEHLVKWSWMEFKAAESHPLVLSKGKVMDSYRFMLESVQIASVGEKSIKSFVKILKEWRMMLQQEILAGVEEVCSSKIMEMWQQLAWARWEQALDRKITWAELWNPSNFNFCNGSQHLVMMAAVVPLCQNLQTGA